MTENIKSVGRVGVAPMQCVGGPHDGESHWAVVGSALVVKVKMVRKQSDNRSYYISFFGGSGPAEGDEWKDAGKSPIERDEYAVYLPNVVAGRATGFCKFEGCFVTPPAKPETK